MIEVSSMDKWMVLPALVMAAIVFGGAGAVVSTNPHNRLSDHDTQRGGGGGPTEVAASPAAIVLSPHRPVEVSRWVRLCMAHRPSLAYPEMELRWCMAAARLVFP